MADEYFYNSDTEDTEAPPDVVKVLRVNLFEHLKEAKKLNPDAFKPAAVAKDIAKPAPPPEVAQPEVASPVAAGIDPAGSSRGDSRLPRRAFLVGVPVLLLLLGGGGLLAAQRLGSGQPVATAPDITPSTAPTRKPSARPSARPSIAPTTAPAPPAPANPAPPAAPTAPVPGQPGQVIVIGGATLNEIAASLGKDPQAIVQANGITNPNLIFPGQILRIP